MPRDLALGTLNTIYTIIFPFADIGSQSILNRLIRKEGFDTGCRRSASTTYRRPDADQLVLKYLGTRLMDLYDEVDDPTPGRCCLESWLQRRSGARYVMMATLVGVAIAVILGILGLAVGIFQAWVGGIPAVVIPGIDMGISPNLYLDLSSISIAIPRIAA